MFISSFGDIIDMFKTVQVLHVGPAQFNHWVNKLFDP